MEYTFFDFLTLIGALGFFIYGMKVMSEGIQKVAGSQLRQILGGMTSNRFKGILTGLMITSLVQSSSATTVMVVSFVNAGLLTLIQSIGLIMGANIGTTVTAWLISTFGFGKFSIAALSLPIIAFGFPMMFIKKGKVKFLGEVLIGFALLFMGLSALKSAVPDLKGNPEALEFLARFTGNGLLSTLFFVLVGTIVTVVVQSSSAAMALTLTLLNKELITFDVAAAMVLGENIGTTITANIAAMIANVHAKRAARAHLIFNIFGVVWIMIVFPYFLDFVNYIWGSVQGFVSNYNESATSDNAEFKLSLFHTLFNIFNVLFLIWFTRFIAKTVTKMVPSKGDDEEFRLEYITSALAKTPELSLLEAKKELAKYGEITSRMSDFVQKLIEKKKLKARSKLMEKIKKYEDITDRVEVEIADFLAQVSTGNISNQTSARVRSMLSVGNDLERIGDLYYQMSLAVERKNESNLWFTENQKKGLSEIMGLVDEAFVVMNKNLSENYPDVTLDEAFEAEQKINQKRDQLKVEHLQRLEKGQDSVMSGLIYGDMFNLCEKIGDHIINISEAITGELEKEKFDNKY